MAVHQGVKPRHQVRTALTPRFEDLTRHLAAAVHVVDRLADELIDEFLRGPNRAIPASPGVNPVIVLSEAVASRRRRVVRDVFVLVLSAALLVGLLVGLWPVSLSWPASVGAGLLTWTLIRNGQRQTEQGRNGQGRVGTGGWVLVLVVASGVGLLTVASTAGPLDRLGGRPAFGSLASVAIGSLLLLTAFVDRLYVHGLVRDRFGPGWLRLIGRVQPTSSPSGAWRCWPPR